MCVQRFFLTQANFRLRIFAQLLNAKVTKLRAKSQVSSVFAFR
jgi:hypothetical protein